MPQQIAPGPGPPPHTVSAAPSGVANMRGVAAAAAVAKRTQKRRDGTARVVAGARVLIPARMYKRRHSAVTAEAELGVSGPLAQRLVRQSMNISDEMQKGLTHNDHANKVLSRALYNGGKLPVRDRLFLILNDPSSSGAALFAALVTATVVIASTILFVISSVKELRELNPEAYDQADLVIQILFAVELLLRLVSFQPIHEIFTDFGMWVDLCAAAQLGAQFGAQFSARNSL